MLSQKLAKLKKLLLEKMAMIKKIFIVSAFVVLFSAMGAQAASASTVTRSFSNAAPVPGDSVTVSLAVEVTAPDSFYLIDDVLPAGWTISVPGTGDTTQAGHIKWAVLSGAVSTTLSYTVVVPADASGVSTFSGEFAFDSTPVPVPTLGATDVTVNAPAPAPTPVLTTINVTPATASVETGATSQLSSSALDQNGSAFVGATIVWTSSDTAVATVSNSGLVTGVSAGTATITAADGLVNGSSSVSVNAPAPAPTPDVISPVITIVGDNPATVVQNAVYTDAGATALDDVDGDITLDITVTGLPLDTLATGTQSVIYDVSDAAGNTTIATRIVNVVAAPIVVPEVGRIDLVLANSTIAVGATTTANADVFDQNGIPMNPAPAINWSVNNKTVADFGSQEVLVGLSAGTAVITASIGATSSSATLTVTSSPVGGGDVAPVLTSISVSPVSVSVESGFSAQLSAVALDQNGAAFVGATIVWTSSDTAVATVNASGLVTGVSAGSATITAADGLVSGSSSVTVTAPAPAPASVLTSVLSTPVSMSVLAGGTAQLFAEILDQNGNAFTDPATVTWTSSDTAVATVDAVGLVTAISAGSATITATAVSGATTVTDATAVNVLPANASTVTRSFDTGTPAPGGSVVVSLAVNVAAPDTFYIIDEILPAGWTVSVPGTGDITQAGHIKWVVISGAVSTTLQFTVTAPATESTATFSGEFAFDSNTVPVPTLGSTDIAVTVPTVAPVLTTINVTPATASVETGATSQLSAGALDQNGSAFVGATIVWASSDTAVATVDTSGLVTGVSLGSATITASSGLLSGSTSVTVTAPAPFVPVMTSFSISPAVTTALAGGTLQLNDSVLNQNGGAFTGAAMTWVSSDTLVATVDATGMVTAVSTGSVTITATAVSGASSLTDTSVITILPAGASTVTRSFSTVSPVAGGSVVVSLAVNVASTSDTFYIIDEILPAGWTVSVPGTGDITQAGHIKWAVISGAVSEVLQYTVQVPAGATGVNVFSGEFGFDSNLVPVSTLGLTDATISVLTTINVTPATASVETGATSQLSAGALDQNGSAFASATIVWTSSDTAVATVNASGLVTGVSAGSANITASSGLVSGSSSVTVSAPVVVSSPAPVVNGGGGGGGGGGSIIGGAFAFGAVNNSGPGSNSQGPSSVTTANSVGQVLGAATHRYSNNFRRGSRGNDVMELQKLLKSEGLFSGDATGFFGPITENAVKAFQKKYSLPQTGFVGPLTRGILNSMSSDDLAVTFVSEQSNSGTGGPAVQLNRNLSVGTRGDDVSELQRYLRDVGLFSLEPTGYFGQITKRSVQEFQRTHKLPTTGFVGPMTREVIHKSDSTVSSN